MFQAHYEEITRFAAEGEFANELQTAKLEYIARTGEMFETDPSFERRIAAFLEWYVLDRPISKQPQVTPAEVFCGTVALSREIIDQRRFRSLTCTRLSLFEFQRVRGDSMQVIDLISDEKLDVFERRTVAGLDKGDLIEGRLVPFDGQLYMSEVYYCHPRLVRGAIQKAVKRLRRDDADRAARIDIVHRVAYFANRSERYKHVHPKKIFAELMANKAA